jgi:2'-5' RNA ligase
MIKVTLKFTYIYRSLILMTYDSMKIGLYRWPPHINMVYPFALPDEYERILPTLQDTMIRFKPFTITLNKFDTFGGRDRGVLWLHPESSYGSSEEAEDTIIHSLHAHLNDVLSSVGVLPSPKPFNPHMTVSHYSSKQEAEEVRARLQAEWKPISFVVNELLVMERRGDNGQFHIAWRLPLRGDLNAVSSEVHERLFERFERMPAVEEEWVRDARVEHRRVSKYGSGAGIRRASLDSIEQMEAKRKARALKKQQLEMLGHDNSRQYKVDTPEEIAAKRATRALKAKQQTLEQGLTAIIPPHDIAT